LEQNAPAWHPSRLPKGHSLVYFAEILTFSYISNTGWVKMTRLEELEKAVDSLPEEEYRRFRDWFMEKDWQRWDRQIAEDSSAGKLDFLVEEALEARKKNELRDL
jgi:hypothetical protein